MTSRPKGFRQASRYYRYLPASEYKLVFSYTTNKSSSLQPRTQGPCCPPSPVKVRKNP